MSRNSAELDLNATKKLHHALGLALNSYLMARKSVKQNQDPEQHIKSTMIYCYKAWLYLLPDNSKRKTGRASNSNRRLLRKVKTAVDKAEKKAKDLLEDLKFSGSEGVKLTKKRRRLILKDVMDSVYRMLEKTSLVTARIPIEDLLRPISGKGTPISDISFDIYCPKAYKHHTRLTIWMPRIMAHGDHITKALKKGRAMLKSCGVRDVDQYVIGINSRVNQYKEQHLLMLDFDDLTYDELPLTKIKSEPGVLLKTESGFHFLGIHLYEASEWKKRLRSFRNVAAEDHIDLSLQRGYGTLRLSASPRKPFAPIVFEHWSGKS